MPQTTRYEQWEKVVEYIVRLAELILLSVAFLVGGLRTGSLALTVIGYILAFVLTLQIWFGVFLLADRLVDLGPAKGRLTRVVSLVLFTAVFIFGQIALHEIVLAVDQLVQAEVPR